MDAPVVKTPLVISPIERDKWELRKSEWGEQGPAHNIGYTVTVRTRTTIVYNHTGFVPVDSREQQKKRTFL